VSQPRTPSTAWLPARSTGTLPAPAAPPRWEYLTRTGTLDWDLAGGLHAELGLADAELTALGEEGWELIAAVPLLGPSHLDVGTFAIHYLFKRPRR
jgi:hypothetical protein